MPDVTLVLAIALPLLMIAGTVAALRANRERDRRAAEPWRDDSLDEWRQERREAAAAERSVAAAEDETADQSRGGDAVAPGSRPGSR
jgi:hypothetical protein